VFLLIGVAGAVVAVGVLTHVIPCSGPSGEHGNMTSGGGVALIGLFAMVRARGRKSTS